MNKSYLYHADGKVSELEVKIYENDELIRLTVDKNSITDDTDHIDFCPDFLNSGDTTPSIFPEVTANETRVGGTSISSKLPLIESLPPTAATPRSS